MLGRSRVKSMTVGALAGILVLETALVYAARRRAVARGGTPKVWHAPAALSVFALAILAVMAIQHA
jgi:hypothetical protein